MTTYDYSIYYQRFHNDSPQHVDSMSSWMASLLSPLLPDDRNVRILDIGCGFGYALLGLKKLGFVNLDGLEVSPQQAERAKAKGLDVEVTEDTPSFLRRHRESYDVLLLLDVLEHIPVESQIDFLRACYDALASSGRLIVTVPNANAILSARWRYNDYTHHCSFTEHSLYFVLKNSGFNRVEINAKKLGRLPKRLWKQTERERFRRWFIRWCWLQVFKAELPWERINDISFDLNLTACAHKTFV